MEATGKETVGGFMDTAIKEFLLKEYEQMWKCWQLNYDIRDRWIRLYFIGVSIVFGLLGLEKGNSKVAVLSSVGNQIPFIIFSILSIFGMAIFANDLALRKSRVEFINAINKVREAFKDQYLGYGKYIYLPVKLKENYWGKRDPVITFFLAVLASINICAAIYFGIPCICLGWIVFIGFGCLGILILIAILLLLQKTKGN